MKKKIGAFGAGQFSLGTLVGGRPGTTIFQNPGGGGGAWGVSHTRTGPGRPPGSLSHGACTVLVSTEKCLLPHLKICCPQRGPEQIIFLVLFFLEPCNATLARNVPFPGASGPLKHVSGAEETCKHANMMTLHC